MLKVLIVDAQGGGVGRQLISAIRAAKLNVYITAVGTNGEAASQMRKAGADISAAGENPVVVACRTADVIVGPVGMVIADAMYGEITPLMATAIGQSTARKLIIPINHCNNYIVGVPDTSLKTLIDAAVAELTKYAAIA